MEWIHLNVKSGFSFFHSGLSIEAIVDYAQKNQLTSIALTDENNLFGAMAFYRLCREKNIRPLLGMEVKVQENDDTFPLVVLAKNNEGYQALCTITSKMAYPYDQHHFSLNDFFPYAKHIIVILPTYRSRFHEKNEHEQHLQLEQMRSNFPYFYLGVEWQMEQKLPSDYQAFLEIPCCLLHEVCYSSPDEVKVMDVLASIRDNTPLSEQVLKKDSAQHFMHSTQIDAIWYPFLQQNLEIANSIDYDLDKIQGQFVEYQVPNHKNKADYLRALAQKGLQKRLNRKIPLIYQNRLDYELDIIISTNYVDYFLVVYDYVRYAKTNQILVGPGRGSAAGSLISYVLGITNVDPIKYHLLFERFLNPERISMPDIDIDFIDHKRDKVMTYLFEKYGVERCAHVIAFQTFAARQALRDSAKAHGLSLKEIDMLAKRIPKGSNLSLQEIKNQYPSFHQIIESREIYRQIFAWALKIEGLPRQMTLHAAGIVINQNPLHSVLPVVKVDQQHIATQYDMRYLEEIGVMKLDILGLKNLAIIDSCLQILRQTHQIELDLNTIDLEDREIYRLIRSGYTAGLFQIESSGMKRAIRTLQPTDFEDVVALLALFRPGPMEFIVTYAKRKMKQEPIHYLHPRLQPILEPTYGIIIYQEQIIQILQAMANFTYGSADLVRRAISKKEEHTLKAIESKFLEGCLNNQIDSSVAHEVYLLILKFANYGFNRSHSVSYAMITCQMAYIKAHFPLVFYAALLNQGTGSISADAKLIECLQEMRQRKIKWLPACVNASNADHQVETTGLRFGFSFIKGMNFQTVTILLQERTLRGPFKDFLDFVVRLIPQGFKKDAVIALIHAGAFDVFHVNRMTLLQSVDLFIDYVHIVAQYKNGELEIDYTFSEKPSFQYLEDIQEEVLAHEFDVIGFFLRDTPLELQRSTLQQSGYISLIEAQALSSGTLFECVVMIESYQVFNTKNHQQMARLSVLDETSHLNAVVFPEVYASVRPLLANNQYIAIKGYLQSRQDEVQLVVSTLSQFNLGGGTDEKDVVN